MENRICQSCGMPTNVNEQLGTNSDGSINNDYCKKINEIKTLIYPIASI